MKLRHTKISAIGSYVPERILTNADLEKIVDTTDEWIQSRTGIKERHIAAENEAASDLGTEAFRDLQRRFTVDPDTIDLIIVATITPDMFFPSTAALIQEKIKAKNAWGFDISAACSGFIFALRIGTEFVENGSHEKVLVIGAEKMTSITDYSDRNTCVLFGDGAGAVLIEPVTDSSDIGIIDFITKMDGSGQQYLYMAGGGSRNPATHETVEKKMHFVYQEGRQVFKFAVSRMADVGEELIKRNALSGEDITLFVPHQANKRIIDASAARLKLRDEQVMMNIDKYANTTSATIPLGLIEAMDEGRIKKGDYILLSAFGAGFTWGSALLNWRIDHE